MTETFAFQAGTFGVALLWGFIGSQLSVYFIRRHRDVLRRDVWRIVLGALIMPIMVLALIIDWLSKGDTVIYPRKDQ